MAVIALSRFRLATGVTEEEFVAADAAAQTQFAYHQPGLIRRTTAKGDDGWWLILLVWADHDAMAAADVAAGADERTRALRRCVDVATASRDVFESLPG